MTTHYDEVKICMNLEESPQSVAAALGGADEKLLDYINFKLASIGCPIREDPTGHRFNEMVAAFLTHHRNVQHKVGEALCPADQRIQTFLDAYFEGSGAGVTIPPESFVLDQEGIGRILSLPPDRDEFHSDIVHSYRVKQGVLHNPKADRRTTQGSFHIAEGGLPIPDDKIAVPRGVALQLLQHAMNPPDDLLALPFTSTQRDQARCWVSLLLRPVVCPRVDGFTPEKSMEIRFFAPGTLVGNLDFVESIFGNAGDPLLMENDAALDVEHWTGHTGCVILAPHLIRVTKKALGLPHWDQATERQRRDGVCWRGENECYNGGNAFKLTCRNVSGVMVTVIADNYFGYCKKEVKTQISFAANLSGLYEEEHAGGTLIHPSYDLGEEFSGDLHVKMRGYHYDEMISLLGDVAEVRTEGYAIDRIYRDVFYVSEKARFDLYQQTVSWPLGEGEQRIKLLPGRTYIRPSGYRIQMVKPPGGRTWRLVGTVAEGTFCHKPCTVSGGGKSEISKPITDAILQGSVFVADFKRDFDLVTRLIDHDYSDRFRDKKTRDQRPILSPERSLGSVIKLLTPASEYTDEYNQWLASIPQYIKELVFVVKRYYKPHWPDTWREHFSVDIINGTPGNELKCDNRRLITTYLRVGYERDGSWRVFGLRKDFNPAAKVQMEDDISASVVVPREVLQNLSPEYSHPSLKFVANCETRLFQRPDDAIHPGYDKVTEWDLSRQGNFLSNFEPLTPQAARELIEDAIGFEKFTDPMRTFIRDVAETRHPNYFVSSAHPRMVEGKPSKNPRYLQMRPDLLDPCSVYLSEVGTRLFRRVPTGKPLPRPVNAVLPGRRNNPPDAGIRSLAVFNPIHYLELPELFMEFICSITGKSPSTTGAGSEGALTKGPFNALPPIIDLNNTLVSYILTGHHAFVTAAGHVGPHFRVDHDISLLVPEVWCRMSVRERDPQYLIETGCLEKMSDMESAGETILASRLGWRITLRFVVHFFGRVFNHPDVIFTEKMLRPEMQDWDIFVDGVDNIVSKHREIAEAYFRDGSIEAACPPLRALLCLMKDGTWEGKTLSDPGFRGLFTRESMLESPWYRERLEAQQDRDKFLWKRHLKSVEEGVSRFSQRKGQGHPELEKRLQYARDTLCHVESPEYLHGLRGTLGAQPLVRLG